MPTRVQADLVCGNCGTPTPWYAEHPDCPECTGCGMKGPFSIVEWCLWQKYQADQSHENCCRWLKHRAWMRSEGQCKWRI